MSAHTLFLAFFLMRRYQHSTLMFLPMQDAAAGRSLAALLLLDPAASGMLQTCAHASLAPRARGTQGSRAASPLLGLGSGRVPVSPHACGAPGAGRSAGPPVPGLEQGSGLGPEAGPAPLVCALGVRLALLDAYAAAAGLLGRLPDVSQATPPTRWFPAPHASARSQQTQVFCGSCTTARLSAI